MPRTTRQRPGSSHSPSRSASRWLLAASSEGGFASPSPSVLWIIAVAGDLPAEGNDQPYLAIGTGSADPDELAARVDILDRMVATLNIGK